MAEEFQPPCKQGEKGIRILVPAPYKINEERDKLDPVTGEVILDKDGMPQTDGEPIPELEAKELLSTVEGHEDCMRQ